MGRKWIIGVALAAALVFVGCGDSSPTEAPTKAQAAKTSDASREARVTKRHAKQIRHALRLGGFKAPVVVVNVDSTTDVTIGTIGDPAAVCNMLVNGYAPPKWMTHVYVSSTNKGSASWMPGDVACEA